MRIVIDVQPLQTDSRFRGIGRYTSSFVRALIRNRGAHEIILVTSNALPRLPAEFLDELQKSSLECRFAEWVVPLPVSFNNECNRHVAEIIRELFLSQLKPDVVVVTSLFEGYGDNAICSIKKLSVLFPVSVVLYDLIPLINSKDYLEVDAGYKKYYMERIDYIRRADLCLSISEHSKDEAIEMLHLDERRVANISTAIEGDFIASIPGQSSTDDLLKRLKITKRFVLYVGGSDSRKNLDRLIVAFSLLPKEIGSKYQLVFAGGMPESHITHFYNIFAKYGRSSEDLIVAGYLQDIELVELYKRCELFVFPSIHEGFGLPALEAMACGAPVIGSNVTSLPEVIGAQEAMFDPFDVDDMAAKLKKGLVDIAFREFLVANAASRLPLFSWDKVAKRAIQMFESLEGARVETHRDVLQKECYDKLSEKLISADEKLLVSVAHCIAVNELNASALGSEYVAPPSEQSQTLDKNPVTNFYSAVPNFDEFDRPLVFSSTLCRQQHFHLPLYTYWCKVLAEAPRFHRKQWEFVYICQVLNERGFLRPGATGLGFGVGREPLVSYFASRGVSVLATDLDFSQAQKLGWVSTDQHSSNLDGLNERRICDEVLFSRLAKYREVDMNRIPADIGRFDFCWSSCAFEHLGSIRKGLDFVKNSSRLLKPGGVAVHTTEYNVSSNTRTLDNNPSFVIFRRCDIEQLVDELQVEGYCVEPIDFAVGADVLEKYVDLPPYTSEPHLRLQLAGEFVSTSLGIVVRAPD